MDRRCIDSAGKWLPTAMPLQKSVHNRFPTLAWFIALSLILGGCGKTTGIESRVGKIIDLTDKFSKVASSGPDENVNPRLYVTRKGSRKESLVLLAPVSVNASLNGASGRSVLEGLATPMFNIGDGIQLDLFRNRKGERHLIGSRYFDAGRKAADRNWIPFSFPLDLVAGDQLELTVSAGPQGDLVADWLALSSLRLMQRNDSQ